ncbi:hypothetical protein ma771 [Moumouvirus australiensis]|uniref:EF-hand domain-containing protein n=1 Tax=Moumouvirus australiensis TaxID=2109587 RepID=A0A2P1EMQ7_9VIRU|nr:hypothetical protein QKC55_gp133 [Moumouvirus australiensis]AVL95158.1 hypothetical protein ma771 [Moumouvirus australiensis]
MGLFQVFYENKNEITPVSTSEYYTDLQSAIDFLLKTIRSYKKNEYGKNFYDPIDMNCDYNIYIYNVEVWKNISTGRYKFDTIGKVFPKTNKTSKELDIYIKLYDKPDMNVAKLCLEMYGQNITYEEIKTVKKNYIEDIINDIDEKFNKNKDKKIVFEISESRYCYCNFYDTKNDINVKRIYTIEFKKFDKDGNQLVSFNDILGYLDCYYKNKGYILKYTNSNIIFLFNKIFIDEIREEFNNILLETNILNISYTDPEYKLKCDKKLHLFKNFIGQKNIAYVAKKFLSEEIKSKNNHNYYGKFYSVCYYKPKKEDKTSDDDSDQENDSDQEDKSDDYSDYYSD